MIALRRSVERPQLCGFRFKSAHGSSPLFFGTNMYFKDTRGNKPGSNHFAWDRGIGPAELELEL